MSQNSARSDQYSRRYDILKYHHIGITLFCTETIQHNVIPKRIRMQDVIYPRILIRSFWYLEHLLNIVFKQYVPKKTNSFLFSIKTAVLPKNEISSLYFFIHDVSRWTRDQRHDREQHFCFLPGFTSVDREGRSTSHFHLWQRWRFQFPHHKFSVPE